MVDAQARQEAGRTSRSTRRSSIRPRSVLGLKYVEIERGTSRADARRTATRCRSTAGQLPGRARRVLRASSTRRRATGARKNLRGFGDAFAQRGASLNRTIEEAPRFLTHLEPVMRVARPRARPTSRRFFGELGRLHAHPRAGRRSLRARLQRRRRHVRGVVARSRGARRRRSTKSVPTMKRRHHAPSASSGRSSSAFRDFSARARRRRAASCRARCRGSSPRCETGIPVLRARRRSTTSCEDTLGRARGPDGVARHRARRSAASRRPSSTLNPTLRFVGPYITVCNYFNYSWTHVAEHLTEPDPTGGSQRTLLNQAGQQFDQTTGPRARASACGSAPRTPANGGQGSRRASSSCTPTTTRRRGRPTRATPTASPASAATSERLNAYGRPEVRRSSSTRTCPGNSGTTFTGRPRVPEGQTFDRAPEDRAPRSRGAGSSEARAPTHWRSSRSAPALIALVVILVGCYFGFTKSNPFATALRGLGRVPARPTTSRQSSPVRIAGVNVGKVTERRGRRRTRARSSHGDQRRGPAAARGRDDEDPPAHLPRGQLVRRHHARARRSAPVAGGGRGHPGPADRGAGAVRPGARARCSPTRARTCRSCSTSTAARSPSGGARGLPPARSTTGRARSATRRSSTRRRSASRSTTSPTTSRAPTSSPRASTATPRR